VVGVREAARDRAVEEDSREAAAWVAGADAPSGPAASVSALHAARKSPTSRASRAMK
jgi:hypothetical protein